MPDKPYAQLVTELLAWASRPEEPLSKELQATLGIKPAQLRRWLESCYADLITLLATEPDVLQARDVSHCLYLHGRRKTVEVRCRLPVTPRLYEQVDISLVGAETGEYGYYVEGITYELEFDKMVIHLSLQGLRIKNAVLLFWLVRTYLGRKPDGSN